MAYGTGASLDLLSYKAFILQAVTQSSDQGYKDTSTTARG